MSFLLISILYPHVYCVSNWKEFGLYLVFSVINAGKMNKLFCENNSLDFN